MATEHPQPPDHWNHPLVKLWLSWGVTPSWLRLWGFRLPARPEDKKRAE